VNKTSCSSVNIVNITDCYIGFNTWWFGEIDAEYETEPGSGILPPGSTQRMVVKRIPYGEGVEDVQLENNIFVWNMIVAEGVEASNLEDCDDDEDSKEIPFSFQTVSSLVRKCITFTLFSHIFCLPYLKFNEVSGISRLP
jgi:hypothetical protein